MEEEDIEPELTRGQELWEFLRPRLRLFVEQQNKWGDIRDIYDSHTTSYHEVVSLPPWIRDPNNGSFSLTWDLIQLVFLIYVSFGVPLRVCFDIDVPLWTIWFWVDNIVDAYFIIDLFMNFRTSYKREDGLMEDDWVYISQHYLKTWFIIDLVSCVPVQYIGMAFDSSAQSDTEGKGAGGSEYKALKALRLVRMSKMLRLAKLKRILTKYQEKIDLMQYMEMYVLIAVVMLLAHLLCCFFYLVGDSPEECFFVSGPQHGYETCDWDPENPEKAGLLQGWVFHEYGENASVIAMAHRYWTSMYYVLNALEPHILTDGERMFAVLAELVMAVIYGSVAGVMSTILIGMSGNEKEAAQRMGGLRQWVNSKKMPKVMQKGIIMYFNELWNQRAGVRTLNMLNEMPPQLNLEVTTHLYRNNLSTIPFFCGLAEEIMFKLCRECQPMLVLKGQAIVEENTPGREMYILMSGEVQVTIGHGTQQRDLGYLSEGSFFGESPVLSTLDGLEKYIATNDERHLTTSTADTVRTRTVTAVTECELCYLTRQSVMNLSVEYPELRARLQRFTRPKRKKKVEDSLTKAELAKLGMLKIRVKRVGEHARDLRRKSVNQEQAEAAAAAAAMFAEGAHRTDAWTASMQVRLCFLRLATCDLLTDTSEQTSCPPDFCKSRNLLSNDSAVLLTNQAKIDEATRKVETELRTRADAHAVEFDKKLQRAATLLAA